MVVVVAVAVAAAAVVVVVVIVVLVVVVVVVVDVMIKSNLVHKNVYMCNLMSGKAGRLALYQANQ